MNIYEVKFMDREGKIHTTTHATNSALSAQLTLASRLKSMGCEVTGVTELGEFTELMNK